MHTITKLQKLSWLHYYSLRPRRWNEKWSKEGGNLRSHDFTRHFTKNCRKI